VIIAILVGSVVMMRPAHCLLPPTNMGKYVHQPGDNQYNQAAQQERHGAPAPVMAPVVNRGGGGGGGGGNGWVPTPAVPKPDISIEPIATDEPVVAAGFPPFPDRLDLPVSTGWGRNLGGGGGSYGGGGGAAPGGPPQPVGVHQHYNHYDPGAFVQDKGRGYYKANTVPMPTNNHDQYAHNSPGGPPGGGGGGMGGGTVEPRLNPANDKSMSTEAPAPVSIKQATTQDLSLPDDDFSYKNKQSGGNKFAKRLGRQMLQPLNNMGSMTGMGMGMGMSKVKF
jgi:hypothetical protein